MASETTANLALPYLAAAQAQKHVTHNEALRALDAQVHLRLESLTALTPPAAPARARDGSCLWRERRLRGACRAHRCL